MAKMAKNEENGILETVFQQPIYLRRPYTTRRSDTLSDIKGGLIVCILLVVLAKSVFI